MSAVPKKIAAAAPEPPMPAPTFAQAFNGLHLHENIDLAEALEFFVRGYIDCADTEHLGYVPRSCTDQALKTFAHHDSWGDDDGSFPWDRLDRAWKHAAMQKLVDHVRDGRSLAERAEQHPSPLLGQGTAGIRRTRASIEEEDGEPAESLIGDEGSSAPSFEDPDDADYGEANPFKGVQGKTPNAAKSKTGGTSLPISRSDLPWDLPSSSSPESPSQIAVVRRRARHSDVVQSAAAASSSPLTSLNSSMLQDVLAARTDTSHRRQTRALTRAGSIATSGRSATLVYSSSSSPAPARRVTKQTKTKKQQRRGKAAAATDNGDKLWPFHDILDSRVRGEDVEYRVKWVSGRPTWQPSLDLQDVLEEIAAFHARLPGKPGPPEWFARGVARAGTKEEEEVVEE